MKSTENFTERSLNILGVTLGILAVGAVTIVIVFIVVLIKDFASK